MSFMGVKSPHFDRVMIQIGHQVAPLSPIRPEQDRIAFVCVYLQFKILFRPETTMGVAPSGWLEISDNSHARMDNSLNFSIGRIS